MNLAALAAHMTFPIIAVGYLNTQWAGAMCAEF